jgi:hypothetical protein
MDYLFGKSLTRCALLLSVLGLLTTFGFAQGGSGELTGLVSDPSGAVVANATVTLTNPSTGDKRTTVTNSAGIYRFSAVTPGNYSLEASPKGFKSVKVSHIVVTVGATATQDVKLEVGQGSEQITVEGGGQQLIQTEDASLSQLIDRRVWEQMPLEARNPNDFINMVAGAVPEETAGHTFRGAAVNGTRTGTGNYMIEGMDNNEQGQGGVAVCGSQCGQGGANTSISPDAIQEYRVITHDFAAEYGKAGGFVTDTVLKGGTNQWHGSLFEYNRVQALTANDWFSNNAGVKDHLVRNQFGGSVGGPIIKDKTFFFATVEAHRLRVSQPTSGISMTRQFYDFVNSGQFATFVNSSPLCAGACPDLPTTVGPVFQSLLTKFPEAMPLVNSSVNCASDITGACIGQGAYTTGLAYPVPIYGTATESDITPVDQYRGSIKFDQRFSDKDQVGFTYLAEDTHFHSNIEGSDTTFGVPLDNPNRAQTGGITWTRTFSPTVLNQVKFGYSRRKADFFAQEAAGIPSQFTIDALVSGFGTSAGIPQLFTENQFQLKDDLSVTKGKHSLKFGGEYRRTRNGSSFFNDRSGTFASWSAEDLITDSIFTDTLDNDFGYGAYGYGGWYYAGASINPTNGQLPEYYRGYRANEVGMYAQDDWRISNRITMNVGLRWEYFGPPHNFRPDLDSNFYFGSPATPIPCRTLVAGVPQVVPCTNPFFPANSTFYAYEATAVPQVRNTGIWNKDLNNFAPRFGVAWDLLGNQKIVVRAGYGIFYDRMYNNIYENIRFNPPFFADEVAGVFRNGTALGPLKQPGLFTIPFTSNAQFISPTLFPTGLPKPVPRHMDQNLVSPYYQQYSFGLQYQLAKDFALETNYVGTLGRKLLGILNRNTFDGRIAGLGSAIRPNPLFNSDNARGNYYGSNYNALNVTLRKRFSAGLSFNANYTYAKALDELSDVFRGKNAQISATDVQNIRYDYGPADYDVRHRFVIGLNYDIPFMRTNRWLGGWAVNTITSWNTGSPIALIDGLTDANQDGVRSDRPDFVGSGSILDSIVGKVQRQADGTNAYVYLDPSQFAVVTCPASVNGGLWCNANTGRNAIPGPMYTNVDLGIDKAFRITEGTKLTFQANFFDLFNHPNFENPGQVSTGSNNFSAGTNPTFGQSLQTYGNAGGHRVTQLALRFDF